MEERSTQAYSYCLYGDFYGQGICTLPPIKGSCPAGTILSSVINGWSKCIEYPKVKYICPEGYTKVNDHLCYREIEYEARKTYTCPSYDYKISKDHQTCTKEDYKVPKIEAYCNAGYTYQNNSCVKKITIDANITYTCPEDYQLENDKCKKTIIQ